MTGLGQRQPPRLRRLRESPRPSARTEPAPRPPRSLSAALRPACPRDQRPGDVTAAPSAASAPPPGTGGPGLPAQLPRGSKGLRPDPAVLPCSGHRRIATARLPAATTSRYNITRHRPQAAGAGACAVKRPQVTVAPQPQAPPRAPGGPTQAAGGLLFSCLLCCLIL